MFWTHTDNSQVAHKYVPFMYHMSTSDITHKHLAFNAQVYKSWVLTDTSVLSRTMLMKVLAFILHALVLSLAA